MIPLSSIITCVTLRVTDWTLLNSRKMVETSEIFNVRKNSPNTDFLHLHVTCYLLQRIRFWTFSSQILYLPILESWEVQQLHPLLKVVNPFQKGQSPLFIGKCYGHFARIKRTPSLIQLYSTNAHSNISFILCYCLHTCTIRSLIQLLPLEQDTPDRYNNLSTCTTD